MKGMKKLKCRAGFTLAETLLAVTILLLVSVIVATGMPVAKNAYEKVMLSSNAETTLATAVAALRDELGTAWKAQERKDGGVSYISADTGMRTELYLDGNEIEVFEYSDVNTKEAFITGTTSVEGDGKPAREKGKARQLVFQSDADKVSKLTLKATGITLKDDTVTISGLSVSTNDGAILATYGGTTPSADLSIQVFSVEPTT